MTNLITAPSTQLNSEPDGRNTILILAIEELDALISDLICTGNVSISPHFHDWVADSLTRTVEAELLAVEQTRRFKSSLRLGNPRTVLAHWVRNWTCREIKQQFGEYVRFCPCTNPSVLPSG
jgi:hypothetical protein